MSGFCKIPSSNLHKQLIAKLEDTDLANRIYSFIQTDEFYKLHGDDVLLDNNGEPTIESILSLLNVNKLSDSVLKQQLQKELNTDKPIKNFQIVERVVDFNKQNQKFYAVVEDLNSGESQITVKTRTPDSESEIYNLEQNLKLFNQINKILKRFGIDIEILDVSYFNGEDALLKPANYNSQTKGIFGVINIANNQAGFNALPEEFGHFIIECCKTNPIIQRCESLLAQNIDLCKQVLGNEFDSVSEYYRKKGNPNLLFREVLGRILATSMFSDIIEENSILKRGKSTVKQFILRSFKITNKEQERLITELQQQLDTIRYDFLNNSISKDVLENFKNTGDELAHTQNHFDDALKKLESALLSNVQKYMQIYKRTNPILVESLKSIFGDEVDRKNKQNVWVNQYRELLKNANISDEDFQTVCDEFVTLTYLKDTFEKSTNLLKTLKENFDNLYNETKDQFDFEIVTRNASTIRELKNFLLIYQEQLNELRNVATYIAKRNLQVDVNQNLLNEVLSVANQLEQNIRNIDDELAIAKKQTVTNFCMPFFNENGGDTITVAGTSISKEKVIELSHVLEFIDGDIGSIKMVLDTAYNSPDLLTQIISTAIKSQQEKIRIQTLTDVEELNGLFTKYDVRDTNFMHERDRFGNITGYYVNKYGIDFQKYEIEHRKAMEAIDNRNDWNSSQKKNAKHQWYIDHTRPIHLDMYIQNQDTGLWEVDPDPNHKEIITIPKNDTLWNSDAYNKLSDKQKKLCDAFLEYKHKMDYVNGLRGSKRYFKCVQKMISGVVESAMSPQRGILKNLLKNKVQVTDEDLEYGSNASGTNTMTLEEEKSFWRKIKNKLRNLLHPSDEKQIVDARKTLTDFEHNVYMKVPLNYVEDLDDINMLSTNVYDSLLNYTAATYQHVGMCEIADIAALTLDIANNRKVLQYNASGQQLVDQNNNPVHKNSYGSNVNNQLEFIIRSQIYSAKKKPGATILNGKLSVSKLTDGILRLTSIGLLGYNPFTAINNVLVGKSQMFIEALGEKNMSISNLAKANLEYHKLLFDGGLGELNAVSKDSMLYLLTKTFNPEKDWFQQEIKKDVYKPATLRLIEKLGPSFMMAAGESNLKYTGLIAMLMSTPMKDNNGKVTNLYDSLTIVTKEKNGIKYKELAIKEGYTKPDGKKFTFYSKNGRSDLQKFNDKMTITNHKMHGIYDTEDYIMLKQWEAGRMLMLFRNFMAPFFTKRWKNIKNVFRGEQTFNLQLGSSDDGVYTTAFKFIKQLISPNTELLDESGHLKSRFSVLYHGLNETEKSNFWNFIGEMVATMLVSMLLLFVFRDWDDDEDVWIARANGYFLRRLQTELTYGWSVKSLTEILQSPTAVMGPFNDIMRVIKSIGDDHILQSGPYKGKTRFRANVERAFPIIPNIKDFVNIDTEDKRFKVFEDSFFYKKSEEKEEND